MVNDEDNTDWSQYGTLQSPFDALGYSKELYEQGKKSNLLTDTKNYLSGRNTFLQGAKAAVDNSWKNIMGSTGAQMASVPRNMKAALAKKIAQQTYEEYKNMADILYPAAENVLDGNLNQVNAAEAITKGNIPINVLGTNKVKSKRGRPKNSKNKSKKGKKGKKGNGKKGKK